MQNAMVMSHYKYDWCSQTYPELAQAYKSIEERLDLYKKTHNTEYLIDIANFAMIEFKHPSFKDAKYIANDSNASPGLKYGISYKEMMEKFKNGNHF
ncbi:MAG: hypothetical protein NC485_09900 [Ruminococcus flavefaciens]|nr:hypothetical protein [Ruminococcus flavefaciens]